MTASSWAPAEVRRLEEKLSAMKQRAEAAEARIKASQEQEPVAYGCTTGGLAYDRETFSPSSRMKLYPLYDAPVIQPDVAEQIALRVKFQESNARLVLENAELTRKLAEQQAVIVSVREYGRQHCVDVWNICVAHGKDNTAELTKLLAKAKSKSVPEGWNPTDAELTDIYNRANGIASGKRPPISTAHIFAAMRAMLAAIPQPGGSNDRS